VPGGLEKLRTEIALRSSSARAPRRVLIVDDEAAVRRVLRVLLSAEDGVELREAKDGPEALKLLLAQPVQVLVVDRSLPGMTGLEIVRRALSDGRAEEALVVTGYPSPTSVAEAINAGACGYLVKPIEDAERLRSLVRAALERARLRQVALALGNDLRPWAERALAAGRDAAASRTLLEALQILSSRPEGPARIGVVAERALVAPLALAGQRAEGPWDRSQALAETKSPDVEALVVGEGLPPAQARELVRAVQAQPWPKAVVWAQPAGDFDDALALLHAGVAAIVERPVDATALAGAISRAVDERRRSLKVRALSVVLAELGIQGEAVKAKQAVG
jgi:DNA-binding NtrC family response regulator